MEKPICRALVGRVCGWEGSVQASRQSGGWGVGREGRLVGISPQTPGDGPLRQALGPPSALARPGGCGGRPLLTAAAC